MVILEVSLETLVSTEVELVDRSRSLYQVCDHALTSFREKALKSHHGQEGKMDSTLVDLSETTSLVW